MDYIDLIAKFLLKFKNREKKSFGIKTFIIMLIIVYIIYGLALLINNALIFNVRLGIINFFIPIIFSCIVFGIISRRKKFIVFGIVILLLCILAKVICSPLVMWKAQRNLIGPVNEVKFSDQIQPIDLKQLPTINKEFAENLADKKLGSIQGLGSQVTIGNLVLQSVDGQLYYVAPLEPLSFVKWLFNGGTPGYVMVSATNQSDVKLVTEIDGKNLDLKYLEGAYWFKNIQRYAYFKDMFAGHTDFTFELNDKGEPFWVVTRYTAGVGIDEQKVIGTEIINAQTGQTEIYNVANTPKWVDRIQPEPMIIRHLNKWGELVHGIFNFSGRDKLKTTTGMNLIYNNDECYYYTGMTSVGNDEGLVGFTLTNTRTGQTTMYKTSGATESAAMKSAEGKVQQFKYTASFPYLINIQDQPTYFMSLLDASGIVKQYAMVNVKNYGIVAVGDTLQSTLNSYLQAINSTGMDIQGSDKNSIELTGKVQRIGLVINNGASTYELKLDDSNKIFSVPTQTSKDAALTDVGDQVKINYMNIGDNRYMLVNSFENLTLNQMVGTEKKQSAA
ncbi:MAG: cell shape-determining protein [Sarcina sp.]